MEIELPFKLGKESTITLEDIKCLCIVGANGAGKTRFAVELSKLNTNSLIITAQKSLAIPESQTVPTLDAAKKEVNTGYYQQRQNTYVGNNNISAVDVIYDYEGILRLLFAEETSDAIKRKYNPTTPAVETKLDKIKRIWELLIPHKKLKFDNLNLEISDYSGREGSDGERLVFYLIAKVLCAPKNSWIIIDEPENNLHKAVLKSLYNNLELSRSDCGFIYLTHDIDFAVSRKSSIKVWIKKYVPVDSNNRWDYEVLGDETPIPEHLYLEILGSRNSILFVEGEANSLDCKIYQEIYPEYTIKPVGSCQTVIDSVRAFNEQKEFHHLEAFGIIDRDRRNDADVDRMKEIGIWVLDVAEIENLFLLEGVVNAIKDQLGKSDDVFSSVRENVVKYFGSRLQEQAHLHLMDELSKKYRALTLIDKKDISDVVTDIARIFTDIDVSATHTRIKTEFEEAVSDVKYEYILKIFNEKKKLSLVAQSEVHRLLDMAKPVHYLNAVIRLIGSDQAVANTIKQEICRYIKK